MLHFFGIIIKKFFGKPKKCRCSCCSNLTKSVAGISLFATGLVFSQDCNLSLKGKVVDLHDNSPLVGAVVSIVEINENVLSNANGEFLFTNQCKGKVSLKISHLNQESEEPVYLQ